MPHQSFRCPNPDCASDDNFKIYASCSPTLYVDKNGMVVDSDHNGVDWDGSCTMVCMSCDWEAEVSSFRVKEHLKKKVIIEPPVSDVVVMPPEDPPSFP